MRACVPALSLLALWFLSACDPPGGGSGSSSTGGPVSQPVGFAATASFSTSLPNDRHLAPGSGGSTCTPGSNVDFGRGITGTVTATLGDIGPTAELPAGVRVVGATVPDGVYTWSNRPLNLGCNPTGPTAGPLSATFSFTYAAEIDQDNQPEVCVFRSRADFGSFTVTGIPPLDDAILQNVKDEAHRGVDRAVADRISQFVRSRPFPAGSEPRCDNWSELAM